VPQSNEPGEGGEPHTTSPVRGHAGVVSTSVTAGRGEVDTPRRSVSRLSELTTLADTRLQVSAPSVKKPGPIAV
jgi:hypothetical protein